MIKPIGSKVGFVSSLNEQNKQVKNPEVKPTPKKEDKVSEIATRIQNGTYKIDLQSTSEKMALNLLNL